MLEVWLLGKFEVRLDSVAVQIPSRSEQSLLAYLMLNAGTACRREKLAGLFWPEADESNAKGYLRLALWHIRRAFKDVSTRSPDFFIADKLTIAFNGELDYWLDVAVLKKESKESFPALVESTGVYQGELLPGFYDEWVALERESLRALFERKMSVLVERLLSERRWQETIEQAERWISLGETPEPAYRGLMIARAGMGEVPAAVAAYQRCVEALKKDLDVEPSAETRMLYEKIRSGQGVLPVITSQSIRGFELRAEIGQGGYGAVYRAFQKSVGREVVVKVICPQYANDLEFIRRFEVEAQAVARLEHPSIVPLYDYWREPDGAYLVMRLLNGGNLETLLAAGPVESGRAIELVDQIAAALATAHRQGVVHGDIKPANILLDESGNAYLSDFGIARILGDNGPQTQVGDLFGASIYTSPEQTHNQPASPQADIYSFGVVLYQMLTGKSSFSAEEQAALIEKQPSPLLPSVRASRPDLLDQVDQVIQRATAKDSANRFPDALALAAAFRQALTVATEPVPVVEAPGIGVINPYKGLRAFQEADEADFFGREELTRRLVSRLGEAGPAARFLAVVGPSGSGKSSLVKAGLIPAIRRAALPGSEKWFIVKMVPGAHPFEEMEISLLRIATNPSIQLIEPLRRDERGILRAARLALPSDESELLLVIDQFEEIFTLAEDKQETSQFIESLFVAVTEPRSPVRVVITLRADFFDRALMCKGLSNLLQTRTEVVVPLSVPELESAICSPALRGGVQVEPVLVTAIVADIMEQPGALPLLQYALTELFERREDHRLTFASYHAIGGVAGVLDQRAESVFAGLSEAGKIAARQIFLRLVTLGEGASADVLPVPDTCRGVLRSEMEALAIGGEQPSAGLAPQAGGSSTGIGEAIDAFGSARLLSFDRDAATRSPTVAIAHEALLSEWRRLRKWLEDSRGDVRMQRALGYAASEWSQAGRDASFLLHGSRLSHYESWAAESDLALTGEERLFLDASLAVRDAERAVEATRERREAVRKRRVRNILQALVVVFTLAVLGSLALAWNARKQANLATSRELAGMAIESLEADPELSILLSLQALRTVYTREAEDALHRALPASRVRMALSGHTGGTSSVEFSPDGKTILTASNAGDVTLWDASSGQELFSLPGTIARYSPDGTRLVTGSRDGTVALWDIATRNGLRTMSGESQRVFDLRFSPNGELLASTRLDGAIKVWDTETGREEFALPAISSGYNVLQNVAFSPGGRLLISTDIYGPDRIEMRVWGVDQDWAMLNQSPGYREIEFSPDGRWLAALGGEAGADILLWDLRELPSADLALLNLSVVDPIVVPAMGNTAILDFAFNQDGSLLATGNQDGSADIWRVTPDRLNLLITLSGHAKEVVEVAFSPDGARLATASNDGSVRIWDITPEGAAEWFTLTAHDGQIYYFGLTADGKYMVTAGYEGAAKVWDLASRKLLVTIAEHGGPLAYASISSDGSLLATGGFDDIAKIWVLHLSPGSPSYELLHTISGHYAGPPIGGKGTGIFVICSPDGTRLATGGTDGMVKIWDVGTGRELLSLQAHPDRFGIGSLAFSPDGQLLAAGSDSASDGRSALVKIWNAASGEEISDLPVVDLFTAGIYALTFSPDRERLATGSGIGGLQIWDVKTGEELLEPLNRSMVVTGLNFSRDGKYLVSSHADGVIRVWDASSGQLLQVYTNPGRLKAFFYAAFTPDGKRLIASGHRDVYGFIFDTEELIRLADTRLTRWFTLDECRQYLHRAECPPR